MLNRRFYFIWNVQVSSDWRIASSKSAEMAAPQANSLFKLRFSPFVYTDFDAVCDSSSSIAIIAIALCKANINRPACMPEWGQHIPTPEAYMHLIHISTLKRKLFVRIFLLFWSYTLWNHRWISKIKSSSSNKLMFFLISSASRASCGWSI